tara:strand:+ start:322 stop:705 length:384 start_codon:yes stop_codon:yes gene_type:complete
MLINTPISVGELLDKISILIIKKENIKDEKKLIFIKKELSSLQQVLFKNIEEDKTKSYLMQLIDINSKLWKIEDEIRNCERKKIFDQDFIELARSVYISNDKRSKIKLEINKKFNSQIVEVKSYEEY